MTIPVILALIAIALGALGALAWHWVVLDGGPGRTPPPDRRAQWSRDLPTRPYADTMNLSH